MCFDDDESPLDLTNEIEDDRDWDFDEEDRIARREAAEYEEMYGDRDDFADPGGRSALRASTPNNPRIHPCPNCGAPNRLTPADVARGYQCDTCADRLERGLD